LGFLEDLLPKVFNCARPTQPSVGLMPPGPYILGLTRSQQRVGVKRNMLAHLWPKVGVGADGPRIEQELGWLGKVCHQVVVVLLIESDLREGKGTRGREPSRHTSEA
jgi:hypothetical protein